MTVDHKVALSELSAVLEGVDAGSVETACQMIAQARHILLYGCGREGLQMRGLAMRLYHLGLSVGMVGDMNAPPLAQGDLFIVSAGPGELSTVTALMKVARHDGAHSVFYSNTGCSGGGNGGSYAVDTCANHGQRSRWRALCLADGVHLRGCFVHPVRDDDPAIARYAER